MSKDRGGKKMVRQTWRVLPECEVWGRGGGDEDLQVGRGTVTEASLRWPGVEQEALNGTNTSMNFTDIYLPSMWRV